MDSTPVGDSEKSFSEYFDLRTLLNYEKLLGNFTSKFYSNVTYLTCMSPRMFPVHLTLLVTTYI